MEPQDHYQNLLSQLRTQLNRVRNTGNPERKKLPDITHQDFIVECNYLKKVRNHDLDKQKHRPGQTDFRDTFYKKSAHRRGITDEKQIKEMKKRLVYMIDESRRSIQNVGTAAVELLDSTNPCHRIRQYAVREFWCKVIVPRYEITMVEFRQALRDYLLLEKLFVRESDVTSQVDKFCGNILRHQMSGQEFSQNMKTHLQELGLSQTAITKQIELFNAGNLKRDSNAKTSIEDLLRVVIVDAVSVGISIRFVDAELNDLITVLNVVENMMKGAIRWNVPSFPSSMNEVILIDLSYDLTILLLSHIL